MKKIYGLITIFVFLLLGLHAQKTGEGLSPEKKITLKSQKTEKQAYISWIYPLGDNLNIEGDSIEIKAQIVAPDGIDAEDIQLMINGDPAESKADEVSLFGDEKEEEFSYSNKIYVNWGANEFKLAVQTKNELLSSTPLIINRNSDDILSAALKDAENGKSDPLTIFWQQPDVLKLGGRPLPMEEGNLNVELIIKSNIPIRKKDITVALNRVKIKDLSLAELRSIAPNKYLFNMPLQLIKEGLNEVFIYLSTSIGDKQSRTLKIEYNATRPNLHVLAIGPDRDLKYTAKDANDIGALFSDLSRPGSIKLFNKVNVEVLTGLNATTQAIREKIGFLYTKYESGLIQERDMVIIFISSHGFLWNGQELRVQGADYRSENRWATSISYNKDLIEVLENMRCKKLILMDACHSGQGGAKDPASDVNAMIKKLNENKNAMTTIASSRGDEKSYEDDSWENGAFTKAIKDGLQMGKADRDGNKVITVAELYQYLNMEVPKMVFQIKNEVQNPIMINQDLKNIAIYNLN